MKGKKTMAAADADKISVWSCCSAFFSRVHGLFFLLFHPSYSKSALLWQHQADRAQHELPLALDQADPGSDITSMAAASPRIDHCCTVLLKMPCFSCHVIHAGEGESPSDKGMINYSTNNNRAPHLHVELSPVSELPEKLHCSFKQLSW